MTTKKPAPGQAAGGPTIIKARAETAEQYFARVEGRRGTRVLLDNALAAAWQALQGDLTPIARACVEADRAVVRQARDDDPLGVIPPSPETLAACVRLENMGVAVRIAAETAARVKAAQTAEATAEKAKKTSKQVEKVKTLLAKLKLSLDKPVRQRTIGILAKAMKKSPRQIERYLSDPSFDASSKRQE
jgi:hypothetical protein